MKTLIAYFSWSNNTKKLAESIGLNGNFDIVRIERVTPYSSNYHQCAYVEAREEYEKRICPEIKEMSMSLKQYERVLLFFPIWWFTYPMPIGTFIKNNLTDYEGEVVLFANSYTNDPMYMSNALRDAKRANPHLNIKEGLFNKTLIEHLAFIK